MTESKEFEHHRVVVTGAGGQIGASCVTAFHEAGARVAALDLGEDEPSAVMSGRTDDQPGPGAHFIAVDVSSPGQIDAAMDEAQRVLGGPPTIVVQSAAVYRRMSFLEITPENIDVVLAVNVRAVLLVARSAAARMIDAGVRGAIVNITSVSAEAADSESVSYEASKGAVSAATRGMAVALAPYGIRVDAVAQSLVKFQEIDAVERGDRSRCPGAVRESLSVGWPRPRRSLRPSSFLPRRVLPMSPARCFGSMAEPWVPGKPSRPPSESRTLYEICDNLALRRRAAWLATTNRRRMSMTGTRPMVSARVGDWEAGV